jgi:hypothetical protein
MPIKKTSYSSFQELRTISKRISVLFQVIYRPFGPPEVMVRGTLLLGWNRMKKPEIAKDMARQAGVTEAEAADRLDGVVHEILARLRTGKSATLPGVGRFRAGADGKVRFQPAGATRRG